MPVYEFGSGTMWAVPTIDLAGNAISVPTPVPFGAMQDVAVDISFSVKELYGLYQFPIDVARGTAKLTGKSKVAMIQARLFNQIFGETLSANEIKVAFQESANTGNNGFNSNQSPFLFDLGVLWANNSIPLTRAANAANNGIYSVDANGHYAFGAGDANKSVKVSYTYTGNGSTANQWTINNQLLGLSPFFKTVFSITRAGKVLTIIFNKCISTKLTLTTKLEDFLIPEFDFSIMADDSGQVGNISVTEP
jgi:hypothetical protein